MPSSDDEMDSAPISCSKGNHCLTIRVHHHQEQQQQQQQHRTGNTSTLTLAMTVAVCAPNGITAMSGSTLRQSGLFAAIVAFFNLVRGDVALHRAVMASS